MRYLLIKFVLLVAVILMPLGMGPAAASSAHQNATAGMAHCPGQGGRESHKHAFVECTMACAAALPAADLPAPQIHIVVPAPLVAQVILSLDGLQPEMALPPPKRS